MQTNIDKLSVEQLDAEVQHDPRSKFRKTVDAVKDVAVPVAGAAAAGVAALAKVKPPTSTIVG